MKQTLSSSPVPLKAQTRKGKQLAGSKDASEDSISHTSLGYSNAQLTYNDMPDDLTSNSQRSEKLITMQDFAGAARPVNVFAQNTMAYASNNVVAQSSPLVKKSRTIAPP
jgi:hypothetical protein